MHGDEGNTSRSKWSTPVSASPPEHRARIFEEFYQVRGNRAIRGAVGGMGLGLAIVRRLADLLRHDIELSSRVGRGSRVAVVALRAEAPPPRPQRRAQNLGVRDAHG